MRRSNDLQQNTQLQSTSGVCVDVCVANSGKWESDLGSLDLNETEIYETQP